MEPQGCGCPPTGGAGRVHHVFLNVKDMDRELVHIPGLEAQW